MSGSGSSASENVDDGAARSMIWQLVGQIGTCMMVTVVGGSARARPMRGAARPEENAIWFVADRDSLAKEDADVSSCVCLTYADTRKQNYVSLTGQINEVDDPDLRAGLSNVGLDAYYPGWPDNPSAVLLKFEPTFGEYWDAPSSSILIAIQFLQAKIAGERPSMGASGTASLGGEGHEGRL
jgi:general stress protein 26